MYSDPDAAPAALELASLDAAHHSHLYEKAG
jgi:hypothetical protein